MVNQKWFKDVSSVMNCFGTQEDDVKWLWSVVTMLTNHKMIRGMMNSLSEGVQVKLMFLLDKYHHPRIRGNLQNWKMMFQVPVLMGGGGLAKSRRCDFCS